MGRRKPRYRNAIRRTGDVVDVRILKEPLDGRGVSAVFAADAVAHGGIGFAALGHRHRYHFKNRVINGLEWIGV